jgi:hypothetical protein
MKIIIYIIAFLIVLFYSLYHANTTITVSPFSIEVEHPSALLHIPGALLIFLSMQWIYWIGFKQGRREGQKDCEEINKIGKDHPGANRGGGRSFAGDLRLWA